MHILDIILIAVIGISAIVGLVRGLIKTVFGLASMIIAVLLTIFLTPQVSGYIIETTEFDEMISEKTIELLNIQDSVSIEVDDSMAKNVIRDLPLPDNIVDSLQQNMEPQTIELLDVSNVVDYIGSSIASMAVNALVFIILFIVISIVLNAIVTLLDLISQLPVLDQMNKLGGFLVGTLIGVVFIWIGLLGMSFVISIQATTELSELIETSILTKLFYYNNPLQHFIMGLANSISI